jgi:hypothetical protein
MEQAPSAVSALPAPATPPRQTTFEAICPVTGERATRTSSHPYAGSVTIIARRVADYTDQATKPSVTVRTRGQRLPDGYVVAMQPGRNNWGYAVHLTPRVEATYTDETVFLGSFHESEELARAAAMTWLAHRPCLALVRLVFVPATVVAKPVRGSRSTAKDNLAHIPA